MRIMLGREGGGVRVSFIKFGQVAISKVLKHKNFKNLLFDLPSTNLLTVQSNLESSYAKFIPQGRSIHDISLIAINSSSSYLIKV